jgi:3-methylcrotonyl-CoA carboxylase alpha subunit
VKLTAGGETIEVRLEGDRARLGGRVLDFSADRGGEAIQSIRVGDRTFRVRAARDRDRVFVWCDGGVLEFRRAGSGRSARAGEHGGGLAAPMPGRIRRILASEGGRVSRGDAILVLEAMKMEHAIRATADGVVARIFHAEGDLVDAGTPLAEIRES